MNVRDCHQNLVLKPGEIHLWCIDDEIIENSSITPEQFKQLSKVELAQQKKFYFKADRHQYLITRLCIRNILSLYVKGVKPSEWTFNKNDYGKPSISNLTVDDPLQFNISHSKKMIVFALTLKGDIGVDVENLNRNSSFLNIAKNSFSFREYQELCQLPDAMQKERFFELWTLKEAYIKACGMGLSIALDKASFSFHDENKIEVSFDSSQNDSSKNWAFWCLKMNNFHKISLSVMNEMHSQDYNIKLRKINANFDATDVDFLISKQSMYDK